MIRAGARPPASGTAGTAASMQRRRALAVMPDRRWRAMLAESRTGRQEAGMERAGWLEGGFDSAARWWCRLQIGGSRGR
jgi:hypothetical protein